MDDEARITAAKNRHERFLVIAKAAMTMPTVARQLRKRNPARVYLRCQGRSGSYLNWHRSGWSAQPSVGENNLLRITLWADHDFDGRLRVSEKVGGYEQGASFTWACEVCGREQTQSVEALLTGIVLSYDTPMREGSAYVMKVR